MEMIGSTGMAEFLRLCTSLILARPTQGQRSTQGRVSCDATLQYLSLLQVLPRTRTLMFVFAGLLATFCAASLGTLGVADHGPHERWVTRAQ